MSSIGALDFRMDDWGVDVAVTGSQKAMSLPTGLAYVAASKKVKHECEPMVLSAHHIMLCSQYHRRRPPCSVSVSTELCCMMVQ